MQNNGKGLRRHLPAEKKFEIVKEVMMGEVPVSEVCKSYEIGTGQYYKWQQLFLGGALEGLRHKKNGREASKEYKDKPTKPDEHWHTDIMYIKVLGMWCFLIVVLDGYSRYVVGWKLMLDMTGQGVSLAGGDRQDRGKISEADKRQWQSVDIKGF